MPYSSDVFGFEWVTCRTVLLSNIAVCLRL